MPAHPHTSAVVLDRLCFTWPDGSPALDDVSGAIGEGRTGLVGRNGSGKSTLLRLIAGEIAPASGTVTTSGDVALLPQQLTRDTGRPVADLLGIGPILAALRAIESGDADPRHFEAVGDAWDIESRAHAALAGAGLAPDVLDRTVGELSGGEAVLAAIAGIRLRKPAITLLDEPTNNLDRDARARLAGLVTAWPGALVVVSHDTALLELMDDTAELHDGTLSVFGGPYSRWRSWLDAEQEAARRAEATAAQDVRREKRQRIEPETTIARRRAVGAKAEREKRVPPIVAGNRKRAAQVSAGRLRTESREKEARARAALDEAERRVRDDDAIRIDLPDPGVPAGRRIATLNDGDRTWVVQGPERVALIGPNGAGKTRLLERVVACAVQNSARTELEAADPADSGGWSTEVRSCVRAEALTDRIGYLPQRVDGLDEGATVLQNVCDAAPRVPPAEVRNRLAARRSSDPCRRSRAERGSASRSRVCCWPIRPHSCWCSTSPRTTSTSTPSISWSTPSGRTAVPCWWSATTTPSSPASASASPWSCAMAPCARALCARALCARCDRHGACRVRPTRRRFITPHVRALSPGCGRAGAFRARDVRSCARGRA